ncbi:piggyBac transposable element-derived protein 4-like [Vanessa cardui]|uniref:piggyBac transposable element-derived protein 4-like n=1 Tax=Vanessa cardui TaxID=171605 RepID=UPI001F144502|nr:piggyBac transposable element-derived protein 4-like [Vanessa cardui]
MMEDFEELELTQEDLAEIENVEINLLNNSFQFSSDDEFNPSKKRRCRIILPSDSEEDNDESRVVPDLSGNTPASNSWYEPKGNQRNIIPFTETPGFPLRFRNSMTNKSAYEFFGLMVSDDILQEIVECTNLFAIQKIASKEEVSKHARLRRWTPTDLAEIKQFFGILLFMGLVKISRLSDYWSTDEVLSHPYPRTIMSRNRFELLLQMLHFSRNDEANKSDRLHRIRNVLEMLNANYQEHYTPSEDLCIDESVIPFRGRIIFRQYNKQKRHKYGIKEFKLCTIPGYTYKVNVYGGKNDATNTTPTNVVMELCRGLLNKGHTLYTDNWYTSIDLARKLLDNETHLVGTLRKNRKHLPKSVVQKKLKKGEYIAKESEDGITVMKWRDKREVLVLSTKHSVRFHNVTKRGRIISKPQIIIDYNKGKGAVDLSDQMTSYCTPLRKSIKWYKKIAIDLLLNTSVVNALILYKTVTNDKMIQIVDFRRKLLSGLCQKNEEALKRKMPQRLKHTLVKREGISRKSRRTCQQCYKAKSAIIGAKMAKNQAKKVVTYCSTCPNKPSLCLECFNEVHLKL